MEKKINTDVLITDPFESVCKGFERKKPKLKTNLEEVTAEQMKYQTVIFSREPLWHCEEPHIFDDHYLGYGWQ